MGTSTAALPLERMILNAMPSSVLVVDDVCKVVFVNPAAEQLFGVGRSALEHRPLAELVPSDSALFDLIRRVQLAGNSVSDYGVALPLNRNTSRLVDLHVSPLAERPGHSLAILHPCSVAHRLNHQLHHRGGARSVAGLGATLAHEVKNPLSGIRGAAQLLEHGVSADERALIRLICDETDRICALVDRMEQFADRRPLARRAVNIYEVLEHVRRLAESGFGRRLRFEADYDPSLPEVDGDRDQLVQVFLNLVKNAAEAVPAESGEIRLSTQYTHGLSVRVANSSERVELPITVQIQDNGPGIPEALRLKVFEPFYTGWRQAKGRTGMGLSLVQETVNQHGGVIDISPKFLDGCLVRITLPVTERTRMRTDMPS